MDALFRKSERLLANTGMDIIRDKMDEIHWSSQRITIISAKGVGKSTLITSLLCPEQVCHYCCSLYLFDYNSLCYNDPEDQ